MHLLGEAWFSWVSFVVADVILVALGILVLRLKPRTPASWALGVFATAWGANFIVALAPFFFDIDLSRPGYLEGQTLLRVVLRAISAGGLVAMMLTFPRALPRAERRALVGPAIFGAVWAFVLIAPRWAIPPWALLDVGTAIVGYGFVWAYLLLLTSRWRRATDAGERHQIVLTFVALALGVSFQAGQYAGGASQLASSGVLTFVTQLAPPVWLAVVWLRGAHGAQARVERNLAILPLALAFVGFLVGRRSPYDPSGLLALGTVAILTYAIVRHQVLGIDVKLRFAISKSTVAAVFIAVFFVASEAAQQFFGEAFQSNYVGILAAGALVFAIAPLSRLADRIAEKAVPVPTAPPEPTGLPFREKLYRDAARYALRDGTMTRIEELHLAQLAAELGLRADRAVELRHEIEEEMRA
ncbi:MAG: hypothetical protein HY556_00770 [Euryarchaeota archaeon]|nr:hypothetical protein [Euryarchaeota archaeon]